MCIPSDQELLSEQQQHIQLLSTQVAGLQASLAQQPNEQHLKQLKEELGSLKGIMLSRHQFPPTPTRGGVANGGVAGIPAWQRTTPVLSSESSTPVKRPTPHQEQSPPNGEEAKMNGLAEETEKRTILQNGNGTTTQHGNEDENSQDENSTS